MTYVERVTAAGGTAAEIILAEGMDAILAGRVRPRAAAPSECETPVSNNPAMNPEVKEIFEFWTQAMGLSTRAKLTPQRARAVSARLRDGYTRDRIIRAIQGCAGSDFHMGRGQWAGKDKYNDLALICRNGTKLEEFEGKPVPVERDLVLKALRTAAQMDPTPQQVHMAVNSALPSQHRMGTHKVEAYRVLRQANNEIHEAIKIREEEVRRAGS